MEDDNKSESTIDEDWVKGDSVSSPLETARDAGVQLSEGLSDVDSTFDKLTLNESDRSRQIKISHLDRFRRLQKYLGTQNKPGIPHEFVYNGEDATIIREECTKLAELYHLNSSDAKDFEKIIGLFCEREECRFEVEWMNIIEMLIPFRSSLDFVYNAFCAITTKYLPRSTTKGSVCYHLMHLILQYHDPSLTTHLISRKLNCYEFAYPCFSSLFVGTMDRQTLYSVWDKYFEKGDPFLLFTMLLVFMVNCSEELVKMSENQKMVDLVVSSMRLVSETDVDDLLDVSGHFLSITPPSIKQDFQRILFGSRLVSVKQIDMAGLLALPVDPRDLIRMNADENSDESKFNFFIIDARPHDDYLAGHLEGSYNLDSSLFVEAPDRYKMALSSLDAYRNASRRNHHLLFLGAGHEQYDLYLNMVVANFLQQERKHVALVEGGYKALHHLLSSNLQRLEGHCPEKCKECTGSVHEESDLDTAQRRKSSWMTGVSNLFGAVKAGAPTITEKVLSLTQATTRTCDTHVATSERHGKRYRNERSVFTLSDSDSDSEGIEVISDGSDQKTVKCYLALTRTHIYVLHQTEKPDEVITHARHIYSSVLRVSSKKKLPEMITFKFGYSTDDGEYKETCVERFVLPRAGECVKAIKMNIVNLQPGLLL
ncbi:unnamed protein product [Anisakis simplex]|uniref:TBC1 domain family member 23 n=1 Tax=Anisakis simplex TaxID=6269 RepID=A0A0M3JQV9_ANISI|nr:unnamed protein product [Anisakis simplex]